MKHINYHNCVTFLTGGVAIPGSMKSLLCFFLTVFKMCRQHSNQINFLQQERRTSFHLQEKIVLFLAAGHLRIFVHRGTNVRVTQWAMADKSLSASPFLPLLELFRIFSYRSWSKPSTNHEIPPVISIFGWGFIWKSVGASQEQIILWPCREPLRTGYIFLNDKLNFCSWCAWKAQNLSGGSQQWWIKTLNSNPSLQTMLTTYFLITLHI